MAKKVYTKAFRKDVVEKTKEKGIKATAQELGIPYSTVNAWVIRDRAQSMPKIDRSQQQRSKKRLRRMERIKKAVEPFEYAWRPVKPNDAKEVFGRLLTLAAKVYG